MNCSLQPKRNPFNNHFVQSQFYMKKKKTFIRGSIFVYWIAVQHITYTIWPRKTKQKTERKKIKLRKLEQIEIIGICSIILFRWTNLGISKTTNNQRYWILILVFIWRFNVMICFISFIHIIEFSFKSPSGVHWWKSYLCILCSVFFFFFFQFMCQWT